MTFDEIFDALKRMTVHVVVATGPPGKELGHDELDRGASGLLLQTDGGHFFVSAGHVVSFLNAKQTEKCGVLLHAGDGECVNITPTGPGTVEPAVDLGAWLVEQAGHLRDRGKVFARHSEIGERPSLGEIVYLLGTPEALTTSEDGDVRVVTTLLIVAEVCSAGGDKQFMVQPMEFKHVQLLEGGLLDRPESLSGMSGSPVVVDRGGELRVVGIVKEESPHPEWPLAVAHIDFVKGDGSLRQPWN